MHNKSFVLIFSLWLFTLVCQKVVTNQVLAIEFYPAKYFKLSKKYYPKECKFVLDKGSGDFNKNGVSEEIILCSDGKYDYIFILEEKKLIEQIIKVKTINHIRYLNEHITLGNRYLLLEIRKNFFGYGPPETCLLLSIEWSKKLNKYIKTVPNDC